MKEYIDKKALIEEIWKNHKETEKYYDLCVDELKDVYCGIVATIDELPATTEAEIRNKAIDEFVENISLEISESLIWGMLADCFKYKNMSDISDKIVDYIIETSKKIAEQLKVGEKNE